jgi:hypothetical protein
MATAIISRGIRIRITKTSMANNITMSKAMVVTSSSKVEMGTMTSRMFSPLNIPQQGAYADTR